MKVDLHKFRKNDPTLYSAGLFLFILILMVGTAFRNAPTLPPAAQQTDTTKKAIIVFEDEIHDFGVITEGTMATYDFVFTNKGNIPLLLKGVNASCGCTSPHYSKEPVMPGKSGVISITYNSINRVGTFNKAIYVRSNATVESVLLMIRGMVEPKPQKTPSPIINR